MLTPGTFIRVNTVFKVLDRACDGMLVFLGVKGASF